jgi:hypothetical protein
MASYSEGREKKKKAKKKEKNKKMGRSTVSFLLFSLRASSVVWAMGMGVIPESCSSLVQRVSPVKPDEAPHLLTELEEPNSRW